MYELLTERNITVGHLFRILARYRDTNNPARRFRLAETPECWTMEIQIDAFFCWQFRSNNKDVLKYDQNCLNMPHLLGIIDSSISGVSASLLQYYCNPLIFIACQPVQLPIQT